MLELEARKRQLATLKQNSYVSQKVDERPTGRSDEKASEITGTNRQYVSDAKGAFFMHNHQTEKFPKGRPVTKDNAVEFTPSEAVKWIVDNGAVVMNSEGLDLPAEA